MPYGITKMLKVFLYIATAILAVVGNLGHINKEWKGPGVLIHYIGLTIIFIYSFLSLGSKVALIVLVIDMAAAYISYKIFSSRSS